MSEMIERVARALCEFHIRQVRRFDTSPEWLEEMMATAVDYAWRDHADQARAALGAMREPTEEMYSAGYDATRLVDGTPQFADAGFCLGHSGQIFRAMIDAALAPASHLPSMS